MRALRRAWLVSDPDWMDKFRAKMAVDPGLQQELDAARRERKAVQARRLAEGPAVYEGELYVRSAFRGTELTDLDGCPDLADWLVEQLGIDDYAGASVHVRLVVDLLANS